MGKDIIRKGFWLSLITAVMSHFLALTGGAQIKYTVTRLVPLLGVESGVVGMNSQGDVVGDYLSKSTGASHVFLNHAGVLHDVGSFGNADMFAAGINIYGRIAGNSDHLNGTVASAFTIFNHKFYPLNTAGALNYSMGINNAGHIVGRSGSHAWIWQKSGTIYLSPPKGSDFQAFAINNNDQVAGNLFLFSTATAHAALYSSGVFLDLGVGDDSTAYALNEKCQVTGVSNSYTTPHAFLYTSGLLKDLHPSGYESSYGIGINNSGQVVGYANDFFHNSDAFLYDGTRTVILDTLISPTSGWHLSAAKSINDAGQIAGGGDYNSSPEAFLLTPIR